MCLSSKYMDANAEDQEMHAANYDEDDYNGLDGVGGDEYQQQQQHQSILSGGNHHNQASMQSYSQSSMVGVESPSSGGGGVERLPVSIAELNIKPYKCLECGFRSDRKSDTLRHIRVKHELEPLHAYKYLRIMSIKEASETIDEYESTRLFRKSTSRVVSRDYTLINSLVQQSQAAAVAVAAKIQQPITKIATAASSSSLRLPVSSSSSTTSSSSACSSSSSSSSAGAVKTTTIKHAPLASLDYFRCPVCLFKHRSRLVMKKHLANHYYVKDVKLAPVLYQCNVCAFKAPWQFTVKKHITSSHVAHPNACVVRFDPTTTTTRSRAPPPPPLPHSLLSHKTNQTNVS